MSNVGIVRLANVSFLPTVEYIGETTNPIDCAVVIGTFGKGPWSSQKHLR
jgi:hypothetical protein